MTMGLKCVPGFALLECQKIIVAEVHKRLLILPLSMDMIKAALVASIIMKQHAASQKSSGNVGRPSDEISGRGNEPGVGGVTRLGADHEPAHLIIRIDELQAALEKALRRIERLLGERNQLAGLLDKRDEQIQRLNRELGMRVSPSIGTMPARDVGSSWRYAVPALVKMIWTRGMAALSKRAVQRDPQPEKDDIAKTVVSGFRRPPLIANYKNASPQAILAVVLFGLGEDEIKRLLPVIERDCRASDLMPLLLTDNDGFELFRERGMIFEYLPPAEDRERFSRRLGWDLYIQRRLALIRQKWQPSRVIALGQVAADMLKLWHQSPFEEFPLPTGDPQSERLVNTTLATHG